MADTFTLRDYRNRIVEIVNMSSSFGSREEAVTMLRSAKTPKEMVDVIDMILKNMDIAVLSYNELTTYRQMIASNRPLQG